MSRLLIFVCLILSLGCTNTVPQVSYLNMPTTPTTATPPTPIAQSAEFAELSNAAGPKSLTTTDNYTGTFVLHSGTTQTTKTTDNYTLEVRSLSF